MSTDLTSMTKAQLIEIINELNTQFEAAKTAKKWDGSGQKSALLLALAEGPASILDLANKLNISTKNVSSLICYLKKAGWSFIVNEEGQRVVTKHNGIAIEAGYIKTYCQRSEEAA